MHPPPALRNPNPEKERYFMPSHFKPQTTKLPPVRCTADEKLRIQNNAHKNGLSVSRYIREIALKGKIILKNSLREVVYIDQLRRIGLQLHKQTRILEATGQTPAQLHALWRKLDNVLERMIDKP